MAAKKPTPVKQSEYTASSLQALEGLDAVRKRPAMYIGSTDSRGLTHCVFEIFDNAVDEALAGYCRRVVVCRHNDGSVSVADDGRGIPVDIEKKSGLPGVVLVLTKLHAGGKFGGDGYKVSGGLHGVGASVVNALSERLEVEVDRAGATWSIQFQRAVSGFFDAKKFQKSTTMKKIAKIPAKKTGTRVRFWPDRNIFHEGAEIEWDRVEARLKQTSYLVPGFVCVLRDEMTGAEQEWRHEGGIAEMVEELDQSATVCGPVRISGNATYMETAQVLEGDALVTRDIERELQVDVVLRWTKGFESVTRSFVNVVETPKGGTHVSGCERAVVRTLQNAIGGTKLMKNDESLQKEDILEGLSMVVTVRLPEPQFEGQTKEVLGTPQVTPLITAMVSEQLSTWFSASRNKAVSRAMFEKIVEASRARRAAKMQRDLVRRKSALESSSLPAKLKDCRSHDLDRSELLIIEGDSAAGTVARGRDSEFQAYLPIRGKILNVLRASERKMLDNEECGALITAIGAGAGRGFDIEKIRYAKLIVLADADVDGAHIRCLLLTLCWRYMRPLVEAGRVYAAVPPLYRITLKGSGEYIYCYSETEKEATLADLEKRGVAWKDDIQRYKGLGEMDADQLAETTLEPQSRQLRRMTVSDAAAAEKMFEVLMGGDVSERREYIVEQSNGFDLERLDV
jgi:DNA gyrase subunit B